MNKLCELLNLKSDDDLFDKITQSFKEKITNWEYFVDWQKAFKNVELFEKELNILNYLIGKENLLEETTKLLKEYPQVIKAIPVLLAIREASVEILVDNKNFIYNSYNFWENEYNNDEIKEFAEFILKSGLDKIFKDKKVKNLVDYVTGVEVGLDSNGRKNRGGTIMENLVEGYISDACKELGLEFMPQATAQKIKNKWGIEVIVDKSSRKLDFAINRKGKLYFIECNFYGSGGSKLKSTATEYIEMNRYWNNQGIEFIWITDGAGWHSTLKPLREYFDKADYLLNLEMLKERLLLNIIKWI